MSGEDTNGQYVEDADSSQWYKGKAKDEHKKRLRAAEEKILRNEEDPIQVSSKMDNMIITDMRSVGSRQEECGK